MYCIFMIDSILIGGLLLIFVIMFITSGLVFGIVSSENDMNNAAT